MVASMTVVGMMYMHFIVHKNQFSFGSAALLLLLWGNIISCNAHMLPMVLTMMSFSL